MKFEPTLEELIESKSQVPGGSMTINALQNGKLTLEEVKQGYYINLKGKKVVDKTQWGNFIEDRIKKDKEKEKAAAEKAAADKKRQGEEAKRKQEEAKAELNKDMENIGQKSLKDQQEIYETFSSQDEKPIDPTIKLSPWFWDNINSMTKKTKEEMLKNDDPEVKSMLAKRLASERAKLYADHILNSLSNVALSTSNWTGAEAGHSPNFELKDSLVDNFKNQNIQNYNTQLQKIASSDVDRKIALRDTFDKSVNAVATSQTRAVFARWENDAKYKELEAFAKYKAVIADHLDVDEKKVLNGTIKEGLLRANNANDVVDVLKMQGINIAYSVVTNLLKGVSKTGWGSAILKALGLE